ncbi:MAG: hypothetical protein GX577_01520 [Leptolinea sp.]|nr:hypothetical protein [Leptolinea sp.]
MDEEDQLLLSGISYRDVYQLLRKLQQDEFLEVSPFRFLCLVKTCRQENPLFSNSQAIRVVFTDVLHEMEQDSERQKQYAYILRGRFWNRFSIIKMTTSDRLDQVSPRTFSNEQKKAIYAFCDVLTNREQTCIKEQLDLIKTDRSINKKINQGRILNSPKQETLTRWPLSTSEFYGRLFRFFGLAFLLILFAWILINYSGGLNDKTLSSSALEETGPVASTTIDSSATISTDLPENMCPGGEIFPINVTENQFLRSQGVILFDRDSTPGIINNKVRSIAVSSKGIWIGYFATEENPDNGIGYYDKEHKYITDCSQAGVTTGQNINDIVIDHKGVVWVGMEKGGVASFDGKTWRLYTIIDGLPSDWVYGLFVDDENNIWAATYRGVARYAGEKWTTVFSVENGSIVNDRTHVVAIDQSEDIWIGYIENGLSVFHASSSKWDHYTKGSGLSGNNVRGIAFSSDESGNSIAWIATFDSGVSCYQNGSWTSYTDFNGLPGNEIRDIKVDKYNRVWVATSNGVAYFSGGKWIPYNSLDTYDLSMGSNCDGKTDYCINEENIWTGTNLLGITHSRLPLTNKGVDVLKICFVDQNRMEYCPELTRDFVLNAVIANYPVPIKPGDSFYMKVTVSPHKPNQLLETRGDMLVNIDADETMRFGTWTHIPALGAVESGQEFTFMDTNNPFVAPELLDQRSARFQSTWRIWMHTRMIGPVIRITFTVESDIA